MTDRALNTMTKKLTDIKSIQKRLKGIMSLGIITQTCAVLGIYDKPRDFATGNWEAEMVGGPGAEPRLEVWVQPRGVQAICRNPILIHKPASLLVSCQILLLASNVLNMAEFPLPTYFVYNLILPVARQLVLSSHLTHSLLLIVVSSLTHFPALFSSSFLLFSLRPPLRGNVIASSILPFSLQQTTFILNRCLNDFRSEKTDSQLLFIFPCAHLVYCRRCFSHT